jgi:hypothetical protein
MSSELGEMKDIYYRNCVRSSWVETWEHIVARACRECRFAEEKKNEHSRYWANVGGVKFK